MRKKFYMIANPKGGSQNVMEIISRIKSIFKQADTEPMIHETSWSRHANDIAQKMNFDDYSGLLTVGGDDPLFYLPAFPTVFHDLKILIFTGLLYSCEHDASILATAILDIPTERKQEILACHLALHI